MYDRMNKRNYVNTYIFIICVCVIFMFGIQNILLWQLLIKFYKIDKYNMTNANRNVKSLIAIFIHFLNWNTNRSIKYLKKYKATIIHQRINQIITFNLHTSIIKTLSSWFYMSRWVVPSSHIYNGLRLNVYSPFLFICFAPFSCSLSFQS